MSTSKNAPNLPGLLGNPDATLGNEKRIDPQLLAAMIPFGFDAAQPDIALDLSSPLEARIEFCNEAEKGFEGLMQAAFTDVEPVAGVVHSTETIQGKDGNDITLYIHKPANQSGDLPCIVHIHGGGMAMLTAQSSCYPHWRDMLCAEGLVVVGVEFRNAIGTLGINPYPAGLDDCMAGLAWVNANKSKLGISTVVVSGESGGANLSLAMTMRAKAEDTLDMIQGTYAQCPYIYGDYSNKIPELPSLYENDGYFLKGTMMGVLGSVYDPANTPKDNHLAWPYWATVDDLRGLPPHAISVNQLDPLRDEGLSYYRKLADAGVSVYSRTLNGTTHASDVIFVKAIPDASKSTIRDIKSFADQL